MASRKKKEAAEPKVAPVKAPRKAAGGLMSTEQREAHVARFLAVPRDVRESQLDHLASLIRKEGSRKLTLPSLPEFEAVVARLTPDDPAMPEVL